jgi:U3 small nucleolar RNA-associated protein 14
LLTLFFSLFLQGSWGGTGLTKPAPKPERIKHFPGVDPSKRQDAGKSHVIISEKKDKKAEKFLVRDLPFPYTSKAQFERRMEVPLGMEWNTRKGFQRGTMPRVTKKVSFFFGFFVEGVVVGWSCWLWSQPRSPVHGFTDGFGVVL